jgi:hypothetical protein
MVCSYPKVFYCSRAFGNALKNARLLSSEEYVVLRGATRVYGRLLHYGESLIGDGMSLGLDCAQAAVARW